GVGTPAKNYVLNSTVTVTPSSGTSTINATAVGLVGTITFDVGSSSVLNVSSVLNGTGGLTKQGAGVMQLSAANAYGGNTGVTAGTLLITNTTGSATGTVSVNGATAVLAGTGTVGGNITSVTGGGVIAPGTAAATGTLKVNGST